MMDNNINTILDAHKENETVIKLLLDTLNQECYEISPFIGAGMSSPIYPLWNQALTEMTTKQHLSLNDQKEIAKYLATYQYESAASILKNAISGIRYKDALNRVFGPNLIKAETLKNMPIMMLPQLFNGTIFTTNFERVLNVVYSCKTQITMDSSERKKAEVLRNRGQLHIVKLHGDIDEGNIIFTNEEYNKYYGKNLDTPYVDYLRALFASKTMLFLGCSLKEDRTFSLLKKIASCNEYPHYALLELDDDPDSDAFFEREKILSDTNIRCIWYPKKQHQLVKVFLQHLIDNKNKISKFNYINEPYIKYYNVQKDKLLQTNIIGISENSKLKDVLPECYIDPTVRITGTEELPFSSFVAHYAFDGNVALLATPGMGKSTALKAIIINDYHKQFPNVLFYYLEAKDFISLAESMEISSDIFAHIIQSNFSQFISLDDMRIILLIDSCDELSSKYRKIFIEDIKKLDSLKNTKRMVWLGCRLDYYNRYYDKVFSTNMKYKINICEWTPEESDTFIESILDKNIKTKNQIVSIKKNISNLEHRNPNTSFWRKNPFYLSLFLFCLIDQNVNEQSRIKFDNAYELYGLFYSKWFERHNITKNQKKIRDSHTQIALSLYNQKGESFRLNELLPQDTIHALQKERAFLDLLRINLGMNERNNEIGNLRIDRFWHESFGEYLIAVDLVNFMQNPSTTKVINKEDSHLRNIVNYDVNSFIKEAFYSFSSETATDICSKFMALYFQLQIEAPEVYLKERWNLLYYIGRLNAKSHQSRERLLRIQKSVLLNALEYESDPRVKRTIIISLMNIYRKDEQTIENKIVEYLSTLTPNSEADVTNRSIQLVYCGDMGYDEDNNISVEFGDLNSFSDTNKISWTRTKQYMLNRLVKNDRTSLIYRLWDLRTLYLFFESRNWETLELKDYLIVCKTTIDDHAIFSERILKLLEEEKFKLIMLMKKKLEQ